MSFIDTLTNLYIQGAMSKSSYRRQLRRYRNRILIHYTLILAAVILFVGVIAWITTLIME